MTHSWWSHTCSQVKHSRLKLDQAWVTKIVQALDDPDKTQRYAVGEKIRTLCSGGDVTMQNVKLVKSLQKILVDYVKDTVSAPPPPACRDRI